MIPPFTLSHTLILAAVSTRNVRELYFVLRPNDSTFNIPHQHSFKLRVATFSNGGQLT
jgi:hypothetical protein